jgi:siroheme synthase
MVISATVAELPSRLKAAAIAGPAVVMIGRVFDQVFDRAVPAGERDAAPAGQTSGAAG